MKYELHRTLFSTHVMSAVAPEDIAVGNTEAVETLFKDMAPLEFVNEVLLGDAHPASERYGEVILTKEWAESFANAINKKPGFLYAKGHEDAEHWFARAVPSGYIVGAKVDNDKLLLRNRLLERTSPENAEFMRQTLNEIKAGLLSTSTGDYQKRRIEIDDTGNIKQFAIESVKNQTNALVEHDMHASDATIVASNFKLAYYDEKGNIISKDAADGGVNSEEGEVTMKEHIEALKAAMKSDEIASSFGFTLLTTEQSTALKKLENAEARVGDIEQFVNTVLTERTAVFEALKEAELKEAFKEAEVLEAAQTLFTLKSGTVEEIKNEVSRLKELSGIKKMQGIIASGVNYTPANSTDVTSGSGAKQDVEA